jgi:hypothetical protein
MSATLIPWPLRWLAGPLTTRCRFDNLAKIPRVTCPILIVQGAEDTFVPAQMGDRLAAAARTKVTRLLVPRAQHADIWDVGGKKLWQELADWIQQEAHEKAARHRPAAQRLIHAKARESAACRPLRSKGHWRTKRLPAAAYAPGELCIGVDSRLFAVGSRLAAKPAITPSPSASAPRSCVAPLRAAACCFPARPHTTGSYPCFRRTQTRPAS